MKKASIILLALLLSFCAIGCKAVHSQTAELISDGNMSNVNTAPNEKANPIQYAGEMTLDFYFGCRTGTYSGEVNESGLPTGYGKFESTTPDGVSWKYEGDWLDGHWEGNGKTTWSDGSSYEGALSKDTQNGYGTFVYSTGERYEGIFVDGQMSGYGTIYLTEGQRYEGNFESGVCHGEGTFYWDNGAYFIGTFDDFHNAAGVYHDALGFVEEAKIVDGELQLGELLLAESSRLAPKSTESMFPENAKAEIERQVKQIVRNNYTSTDVSGIVINENLGTSDKNDDYVLLVYLDWNVKNSAKTTCSMLSMYSEDFSARIADAIPSVSEFSVFWRVPYYSETDNLVKYSYERLGNGMYQTDELINPILK